MLELYTLRWSEAEQMRWALESCLLLAAQRLHPHVCPMGTAFAMAKLQALVFFADSSWVLPCLSPDQRLISGREVGIFIIWELYLCLPMPPTLPAKLSGMRSAGAGWGLSKATSILCLRRAHVPHKLILYTELYRACRNPNQQATCSESLWEMESTSVIQQGTSPGGRFPCTSGDKPRAIPQPWGLW